PEMFVQPLLAWRARDQREIIPVLQAILRQQLAEAPEHPTIAMLSIDGQQPDLAQSSVGRQVGVQVAELRVERKRSSVAHGDHPDHLAAIQADDIGVLAMEFIDQRMIGVRRVLRDLLDERHIVEMVNLRELPIFGSDLELKRSGHSCYSPLYSHRLLG